jgi:Fe-S cluster biosynthesis and repair protein YggX
MSEFMCNRCGKSDHPQMTSPPVANAYWAKVQAVTCQPCWLEWRDMEVKIINEYRLNMLEKEHRKALKGHMHDFLNTERTRQPGEAPNAPAEVAQNFVAE